MRRWNADEINEERHGEDRAASPDQSEQDANNGPGA
jgi:hypothetical protein